MTDDQQRGEELDEALPSDFPPDEPTAVDDTGTTGVEQLGGESFAERDRRTEPEAGTARRRGDTEVPRSAEVVESGARPTGGPVDDVLLPVDETGEPDDPGALAEDDEITGDETGRDVSTERTTPPAEESAVHVEHE
jgi:hypothetical protein